MVELFSTTNPCKGWASLPPFLNMIILGSRAGHYRIPNTKTTKLQITFHNIKQINKQKSSRYNHTDKQTIIIDILLSLTEEKTDSRSAPKSNFTLHIHTHTDTQPKHLLDLCHCLSTPTFLFLIKFLASLLLLWLGSFALKNGNNSRSLCFDQQS